MSKQNVQKYSDPLWTVHSLSWREFTFASASAASVDIASDRGSSCGHERQRQRLLSGYSAGPIVEIQRNATA